MNTTSRTRGHLIRAAIIAAVALILGGITGHVAAHAADAPCIPTAGQDYVAPTYAVDAEYTRTTPGTDPTGTETIPNPDYRPAWTETVQHPAETHVVTHLAQYATEHLYVKQVRGIYQQQTGHGRWQDTGETFDWETWTGNLTRWEPADFTETGPHSAVQSTDGKKRKVTTTYRYVQTGQTRQGDLIKAAWDETVVDREAWTETIEHPATGGDPTIPNPGYTPGTDPTTETAWSETAPEGDGWEPTGNTRSGEGITRVVHPGQPAISPTVCDDRQGPTGPDQGDDVTAQPVAPVASPEQHPTPAAPQATTSPTPTAELAETGGTTGLVLGIAATLLAAGSMLILTRRTRRSR